MAGDERVDHHLGDRGIRSRLLRGRSAAAQALLDRGFGRPLQAIKHGGDEDAPPIAWKVYRNISWRF
jgi:hypothetical protein